MLGRRFCYTGLLLRLKWLKARHVFKDVMTLVKLSTVALRYTFLYGLKLHYFREQNTSRHRYSAVTPLLNIRSNHSSILSESKFRSLHLSSHSTKIWFFIENNTHQMSFTPSNQSTLSCHPPHRSSPRTSRINRTKPPTPQQQPSSFLQEPPSLDPAASSFRN